MMSSLADVPHRPTSLRLPEVHPLIDGRTAESPLIRAYRGERPEFPPIWFMRQAGRSLPEYRQVRAGMSMLEACLKPEVACELTLQPVRRHGVDAAIFFSDIVTPLKLAGVAVDIVPEVGPVFDPPIRSLKQVRALPELEPSQLEPIRQAVAGAVEQLGATPLIGFAGAPFTVASYMVEGRASRDHLESRSLLHSQSQLWSELVHWCARTSGVFLDAQVQAGASAVQVFDSWAGALGRADYREYAMPASRATLDSVRAFDVPMVHFGTGTAEILDLMGPGLDAADADVVGVDYRLPLDEANRRLGAAVPLQGNVDPALLTAPWPMVESHVRKVLHAASGAPSHVVNLGHGVPRGVDPSVLTRMVELVHSMSSDELSEEPTAMGDE